jgi:hypothetical protein
MPFQLIYSSWAAPDLAMADLERMLAESRIRNRARDITGVLVLVDGVFLQILEGEKNDVLDLMEKIKRDPRHHGVKVYRERETDGRAFASWSMAYLSPCAEEVSKWAELDGTTTIETVLSSLESEPDRLPGMVVNILKAIAELPGGGADAPVSPPAS